MNAKKTAPNCALHVKNYAEIDAYIINVIKDVGKYVNCAKNHVLGLVHIINAPGFAMRNAIGNDVIVLVEISFHVVINVSAYAERSALQSAEFVTKMKFK
jgi:hypothetical protein